MGLDAPVMATTLPLRLKRSASFSPLEAGIGMVVMVDSRGRCMLLKSQAMIAWFVLLVKGSTSCSPWSEVWK